MRQPSPDAQQPSDRSRPWGHPRGGRRARHRKSVAMEGPTHGRGVIDHMLECSSSLMTCPASRSKAAPACTTAQRLQLSRGCSHGVRRARHCQSVAMEGPTHGRGVIDHSLACSSSLMTCPASRSKAAPACTTAQRLQLSLGLFSWC